VKKPRNSRFPASFRDPSGTLFFHNGSLYRQVNRVYKEHYDRLMGSGLYRGLVDDGLLVAHEETEVDYLLPGEPYRTIKPEPVPFISYPYEWCFSELKDAALTTLRIQKRSLDFGMSLKDSSAYNIQFMRGKPVLIDTLSFETYREGSPWVAYRQFCQHFLAPLSLMAMRDIRLGQLLRIYIDGVPLDLASALLPKRTRLKFSLQSHIHLHAKYQRRFADKGISNKHERKMGRKALLGIIDNLETTVRGLSWHPEGTEWAGYYDDTNYSEASLEEKKKIVSTFLDRTGAGRVWDLGANTGVFSRIAAQKGVYTVSFDMDPACIEKNYLECKKSGEKRLLPLVLDLTNPSSSIGWANTERMSLTERGPADTVLALALIHHLAISNNLPLAMVAEFFSRLANSLIIEFVPKSDSQVQRLLASREDIFPDYTREGFERAFGEYFTVEEAVEIEATHRTLYLMSVRTCP